MSDADKDYADMRRFQKLYIDADHALRAEKAAREAAEKENTRLRGAVERLALKLCKSVEQYDAAGRHAKSDFRDGLREAESDAAAALAAVLRDTRPTSDKNANRKPERSVGCPRCGFNACECIDPAKGTP